MCQSAPIAETPVVNEPQVFTYFPPLIYTYTIVKTGSAAFTVFASLTQYK